MTTMIYLDVTTEDERKALATLECEKDAKVLKNGLKLRFLRFGGVHWNGW